MWSIARATTSILERLWIVVAKAKPSVRLAMSLIVGVLLVRLRNKMKTKKKKVLTDHQRAVILMNRETDRAVSRVKMLEKLYLETVKAKETVK
jgi:ribosomal protein L14